MNLMSRGGVRAGACVLGAVVMLTIGGCLASGKSSTTMTGSYVGPSTYGQIEVGVTQERWVRAALGEPTSETELDDGTLLLKWEYRREKRSKGAVLFIFGSSSDKTEVGATFVEVRDGVVVDKWRD